MVGLRRTADGEAHASPRMNLMVKVYIGFQIKGKSAGAFLIAIRLARSVVSEIA
jgi:hypothetical protein